jgi:hypothetical protein
MAEKRDEPDERVGLDRDPEEVPEATVGGVGSDDALPDVVNDPGVEGGVDAPNEEPEEREEEF